jgi:uncharacterized protein YggE
MRIDEFADSSMPPPQPLMRMSAAAAEVSTPITPGEIEVRARVSVTVEIAK